MTIEDPHKANTALEVRCFSKENFPNGDNRVIETSINISLMELVLKVI